MAKRSALSRPRLREWAYAHASSHSDQRSDPLPFFLHNYNWHRPRHALKLRSPISRLHLPLNNLLSLHIYGEGAIRAEGSVRVSKIVRPCFLAAGAGKNRLTA